MELTCQPGQLAGAVTLAMELVQVEHCAKLRSWKQLEPALLGAQILLVLTRECILTTSAGIPRPRPLSRTGSAALTGTLASPPSAWLQVITPVETCTACPMDWMLELNVEWMLHRAMLVFVLLLMAVSMGPVDLPPPQPVPQHHQQQPLQPRLLPLPPRPPSPALHQDSHVGMLP